MDIKEYKMLEEYKDVLTFIELKEILRIGKDKCYNLLQTKKIKSMRIGKEYRIPKINVINYLLGKPQK